MGPCVRVLAGPGDILRTYFRRCSLPGVPQLSWGGRREKDQSLRERAHTSKAVPGIPPRVLAVFTTTALRLVA